MWIKYLFVFFAFIVDGIISLSFPPHLVTGSMYFVACFGFIALILTVRKMERTDALILALLSGMFYDFFYTDTFLVYTILFVVVSIIVKAWTKHLGDSLIENIIISVSAIFALELFVFLYMKAFSLTSLTFSTWLTSRMFLTIVVNAGFVCILSFFVKIRDEIIRGKEMRVRKEEKLFIWKSKR